MNEWRKCTGEKCAHSADSTAILDAIDAVIPAFFQYRKRSERTRLIKRTLTVLGHQLGYKVLTNGLRDEDLGEIGRDVANREWLFDLQWYTEPNDVYTYNNGYITASFPLVLESEWDYKRKEDGDTNEYSAMKYDLQKVICTNASLQAMLFKLRELEDFQHINDHVDRVLATYRNRTPNSLVLLVAFHERTQMAYFREITIEEDT